jgi:hypothetical protein
MWMTGTKFFGKLATPVTPGGLFREQLKQNRDENRSRNSGGTAQATRSG